MFTLMVLLADWHEVGTHYGVALRQPCRYGDTPARFADNMLKADAMAYLQARGGLL